jgi:hypothetical protein
MSRFSPDESASTHRTGHVSDEIARLQHLLGGAQNARMLTHKLALLDIEAKHRLDWYRSHFNPDQPRVPAGHHDGGQWTSEGGTKAAGAQRVMSDVPPDNDWKPGAQYASKRGGRGPVPEAEPGQAARLVAANARAWDAIRRVREADPNWQPQRVSAYGAGIESDIRKANDLAEEAEARVRELTRYQTEPIIPKQRPATSRERNDVAREIAKWLARNLGRDVESVPWLDEYEPAINAYLDPPRTLEELQEGASTPTRGYQIHHIVEQKSAEDAKFPRSTIDAPENLVRIPTFRHWEINGWYGRSNEAFGRMSPRDYLRGKGWDERLKVGLDALKMNGVLKP